MEQLLKQSAKFFKTRITFFDQSPRGVKKLFPVLSCMQISEETTAPESDKLMCNFKTN